MNSTGTSYGLALASGVNAYLPLLSFAIGARYFHWFTVNQNFAFITQDRFMIALVILAILDIIADKIPVVDNIWDGIHTLVRPIAAAIVGRIFFSSTGTCSQSRHVDGFSATINAAESGLYLYYSA